MIGPFSYLELLMWWAFGIPCFFLARFMASNTCRKITYGTLLGCCFVAWIWPASLFISLVLFMVEGDGNIEFLNRPIFNPCKYFYEWKQHRDTRKAIREGRYNLGVPSDR